MRGAALRGMFIIDDKQNLRSFLVNDDSVGRNVDEAFRLIEAFKFADKNG
jgi:alkyl hydroperoxide reductase subunit AhpC